MREDYGSLPMNMHDDGFGEIGFDTPDLVRDGLNPTIDVSCVFQENSSTVRQHSYELDFFLGRSVLRFHSSRS